MTLASGVAARLAALPPAGVAGVLGAALLALAWSNRFVQDDAFISFRYAANLAAGEGLVWNPGERVEGYTNFLWTILIAAGIAAGLGPVEFAWGAGMVCFACSLYLSWRLAIEAGAGAAGTAAAAGAAGAAAPLVVLVLAGTNFTFSSYATGGLETPLVTALFLAAALVAVRHLRTGTGRNQALLRLSWIVAAGVLTRLDMAVLLAVPALAVLFAARGSLGLDLVRIGALPLAVAGAWLLWKYSYYGEILPRAFYLKAVGAPSPERGFRYLYAFIESYWLAPLVLLGVFRFGGLLSRERRAVLVPAGAFALWCAYIVKVGGDFMEFRFLAPVVPVMMLLAVMLLFDWTRRPWLRAAGIALIAAGSLHHAATFDYDRATGVEPVAMLEGHLERADEDWIGIGNALAASLGGSDGVVVATTAAGAIGYYSGLAVVDMFGLNEPSPPGAGVRMGDVAGHQLVLPYSYLRDRGVHLLLSHPTVTRAGPADDAVPFIPIETGETARPAGWVEAVGSAGPRAPIGATVVGMPLGEGREVRMIYIRPHPAVDAAIAGGGWSVRPLAL